MKNDLTCGVVRDLLPSYVEGLTAPETNEAVERHLSDCADCERLRAELASRDVPGAPEEVIYQVFRAQYGQTPQEYRGQLANQP